MDIADLAGLRRDYSLKELSKSSVNVDPLEQFEAWMNEVLASGLLEPAAMTVSTVDAGGRPSSRVVLLKGFGPDGFVFFTNYESRKGREIALNPQVSLHFFWPELERQVAVSGLAERTSREESVAYFATRPLGSRIGAWASAQSRILDDRRELEQRVDAVTASFADGEVPCPPFWGGIRVAPTRIEFWQGRQSRLHDRIVYELTSDNWAINRLSP